MADQDRNEREKVFSKVIRAGKRTYFMDVLETRTNDYYLIITESKKIFDDNGDHHFQKHKIFLYREDFDKFREGLLEAFDKITELKPEPPPPRVYKPRETAEPSENTAPPQDPNSSAGSYTDVDFDDLGKDS